MSGKPTKEAQAAIEAAEEKARQFNDPSRVRHQPGMPMNVPSGFVSYAIPDDVDDTRRRAIRHTLEERGYTPDTEGVCFYPGLPNAEVWLLPESAAQIHFEARKRRNDAALRALEKGPMSSARSLEGAHGEILQRMRAGAR